MIKQNFQITAWCHRFIGDHVKEGDICVDATVGNGNDTELLCSLVGSTGKVYGFDIQEQALKATERRLKDKGYKAHLLCIGHETMHQHVQGVGEVSCIVFNLGYLPGGDHSKSTKADTSISAIDSGLTLLRVGGMISLCIYSGGDSGFEEKERVLNYLKQLDSKRYLVIVSEYYNRSNNPPIPVLIIKLGNVR